MGAVAGNQPTPRDDIAATPARPAGIDPRALTIQVRNQLFRVVKQLAGGDFEGAAELLGGSVAPGKLEDSLREHRDSGHARIRLDAEARAPKHQELRLEGEVWTARQTILDLDDHNDWLLEVEIDPARTREAGMPSMRLLRLGPIL